MLPLYANRAQRQAVYRSRASKAKPAIRRKIKLRRMDDEAALATAAARQSAAPQLRKTPKATTAEPQGSTCPAQGEERTGKAR